MKDEKLLGADAAAVALAGSIDSLYSQARGPLGLGVVTVELDPAIWNRGYRLGRSSRLLARGRRRMQCCVGVACTALGMRDKDILNFQYPHFASAIRVPAPIRALGAFGCMDTSVYDLNDSTREEYADADRVSDINAELHRIHVPLRFALKVGNEDQ